MISGNHTPSADLGGHVLPKGDLCRSATRNSIRGRILLETETTPSRRRIWYVHGWLSEGAGEDWRKQLTSLDSQNGAVSDFKVVASSLAPVTLRDSTEVPCVLVRYEVRRNTLISYEKLTVCPHQRGERYGIAGHEITRSDSGQHFSAGLTIQERKIISTN